MSEFNRKVRYAGSYQANLVWHRVLEKALTYARLQLSAGPDAFMSLKIDYHEPFVDRLFFLQELPVTVPGEFVGRETFRIALHRIHPMGDQRPLWHPHDVPAVFKLLEGEYEHAVGTLPGPLVTTVHGPGTTYTMLDPDGYHHVRPSDVAYTIMVSGTPYTTDERRPDTTVEAAKGTLGPLAEAEKLALWFKFCTLLDVTPGRG